MTSATFVGVSALETERDGVFAEGDLAQRSSPTPTIAIRIKAPCDRNDIGLLVL